MTNVADVLAVGPHYTELILENIDFSSLALVGARFEKCSLRHCKFSDSDLSYARFVDCDLYCANFEKAMLYACWFRDGDLTKAVFKDAYMSGMRMSNVDVTHTDFGKDIQLGKNRKSDLVAPGQLENVISFGATIVSIAEYEKSQKSIVLNNFYLRISFRDDPQSETWRQFRRKSEVCKLVKRVFLENGYFEKGMEFYRDERVYGRKSMPLGFKRAFDWIFGDCLWGYGVGWHKAVISFMISVAFFAFIYLLLPSFDVSSGLSLGNGNKNAIMQFNSSTSCADKIHNVLYGCYFSLLTSTTASFGDIMPEGWAKLVAAIQISCGLVLISLLVASIAKRIANV